MSLTPTTTTKQCECGKAFEAEPNEWEFLEAKLCPECQDALDKQIEERQRLQREEREREEADRLQKRIAAIDEHIVGMTPERLRATNVEDARFNAKLWETVEGWAPNAETAWLGMVGEPGACKTRIAYLKLRQLARKWAEDTGKWPVVDVVTGPEFKRIVMGQFSDALVDVDGVGGRKAPLSDIARDGLSDLRNADLLLFDEIGEKIKPSPAVMEALFELIDVRHARNRLTIWTCNSRPESFCASWPDEFAGPIAGRIIESSTIIEA